MNEFDLNEYHARNSLNTDRDLTHTWKDSVRDIYGDLQHLYGKESELIRTELSEKASDIKSGAGSMISGGVIMLVGVHVLAAAAVFAIGMFLPMWASALIVAAVFFIVGMVMLNSAKAKMDSENLIPKHSIDAMKEIKQRFEGRYHEFKRH